MTWLLLKAIALTPTDVRPAKDRLLKVFAPSIDIAAARFAAVKLTFQNVCPPPRNVIVLLEQVTVEVPALNVRFVLVPKVRGVSPVSVTLELPRLIVLVLVLLEDSLSDVKLKLLVVSVPVANVNVPEVEKAAPRLSVMFTLSKLTPFTVTALFVNVIVPLPEFASMITRSRDPGTLAPPAPPEVVDQFAVLPLLHVPVPPTQ